jgi:hypothetical protein
MTSGGDVDKLVPGARRGTLCGDDIPDAERLTVLPERGERNVSTQLTTDCSKEA